MALDRDPYDWAADLLHDKQVELVGFSATTAAGAGLLGQEGFHGDPPTTSCW